MQWLREELLILTERLAGKGKGISFEPIILQIEGPEIPTISCVDLPGLTKIPVGGQP